MRSILITIALAIITGGCAIGVKHDYTYADPNWDVQTDKTVAVAVHDRRSYIVDNNKTPDFVGLSRGGWGNPFDVVTASGKPLAADMTTAVVNGLKARNIKAEAVTIAPAQGPAGLSRRRRARWSGRPIVKNSTGSSRTRLCATRLNKRR